MLTPYVSRCAKSADITTQHAMSSKLCHTKNILFSLAKRVLDSKMFVKGDGFSSIAETHSRRYFNAVIQNDYRQVEPSQQTFQKMSNCFGDEPAS